MKKVLFVAAAAIVGLASAYASTSRATFNYGQKTAGSTYTRLVNPITPLCSGSVTNPCTYVSPVDLGATTTKALLDAASATPSATHQIYSGI